MNKARLKEMCCKVWSLLTLEEREAYYYGIGTIGFVDYIKQILAIDDIVLTDEKLDEILDELDEPDDEEEN